MGYASRRGSSLIITRRYHRDMRSLWIRAGGRFDVWRDIDVGWCWSCTTSVCTTKYASLRITPWPLPQLSTHSPRLCHISSLPVAVSVAVFIVLPNHISLFQAKFSFRCSACFRFPEIYSQWECGNTWRTEGGSPPSHFMHGMVPCLLSESWPMSEKFCSYQRMKWALADGASSWCWNFITSEFKRMLLDWLMLEYYKEL